MERILSDSSLGQLSRFIALHFALHSPENRWDVLERNIIASAREFGYQDTEGFIQEILSTPLNREKAEVLASHLTVNETYFWRESRSFEALEQRILPEIIRDRQQSEKRIRIWSAGCSTGEEAYSIAIVLRRCLPFISDWNTSLLATDINPALLQKARRGIYRQWSFRNTPDWLKSTYFLPREGGGFELVPEIRNMVRFEYLNLADDVYPTQLTDTNALDIVFCRNVLMYFTPERSRQIIRKFFYSLREGGYLIVSASELSVQCFQDFTPVNVDGMVLYRKDSFREKASPHFTSARKSPEKKEYSSLKKKNLSVRKPKTSYDKKNTISLQSEEEPDLSFENIQSLYSQGKYPEVIRLLQGEAESPEKMVLLIRSLANSGELSGALSECRKFLEREKINPVLHYLYARIQLENHQTEEAIASLKRAIYLDPDFILAHFSLGNLYKNLDKRQQSEKYYKNVWSILETYQQDDPIPESEGLRAGRLREILEATILTKEVS